MSGHRKKRLGEVLHERKRVKVEELEKALLEQQEGGSALLGELLLQHGYVGKEDLVSALEEVTKIQYVDARFATVEKAVLKLVPQQAAERYLVLPLVREGRRIVAVMAEPQNLKFLDELRFVTGMEVIPRLGFRGEIEEAIKKCYAELEPAAEAAVPQIPIPFIDQVDISDMQFFTASSSERAKAAMAEFEAELRNEKTPAVRLVSAILSAAATKKASDIHIEPQPLGTVVRIRVDGVLRELTHIPAELTSFLVSRIKILSDMDISERRVPQDGRFLVQIGNSHLDLRVSTLPTHSGEKVVMRLLDPTASRVGFEKLGLASDYAVALGTVLAAPQGMLLVTGPTGSGKSTTLYACPFAGCLRSMLRQDPNVIMVGEIRDQETAEIALQAAQTGHLVLSTLHTNDSIAAITRLLDLNVPSFLISASVTAVIAQRLVRKLCACHDMSPMTEDHAARLLAAGIVDFGSDAYIPVGCAECDNSGYKGRVGIYELLMLDEQIRTAIRSGARDEEIRNLARSGGMRLMEEDALEKVKQGITTIEEVLRVVPFDNAVSVRCRNCGRALAPAFLFCPYCGAGTRQVAAPIARKRAEGAPA